MSEEIGKHKGAVETLLHEKKELSRILQIVNSQLERHLSALNEAGVDTEAFIQDIQGGQQKPQQKQKKQQQSRRKTGKRSQNQNSQKTDNEDQQDAGDMLEGEDDFSDRDFSPR